MYVCGSGISQLSASHGFRLKCSSRRTSESKSSSSMRSDCASTPTRGSRFVGLLSMIMTSVLGSGLRAQPGRRRRNTKLRVIILSVTWPCGPNIGMKIDHGGTEITEKTLQKPRLRVLCVSVVNDFGRSAVRSPQRRNGAEGPLSSADVSPPLRIAHFAQDCRPLRPSCRKHVRRHSAPCLICQQGESDGFLGLGGQSELVTGAHTHLQRRELFTNHPHEG